MARRLAPEDICTAADLDLDDTTEYLLGGLLLTTVHLTDVGPVW